MAINIKPNNVSKARNRIFGIIIAIIIIVIITIITAVSSAENRKTIAVVRIKNDAGIPANALITEDRIEQYNMYYKEFQQYGTVKLSDGTSVSTVFRWDDKDALVGKRYAAYYMRAGTLIFWDSTLVDQTRKNSYLYSMSGELLNIHLETTSEFGDMVVPGDSLNVRATYNDIDYSLPSEEAYALGASINQEISEGVAVTKTEMMFSEVRILDMLNGAGESIFDIYYDYISMTKQQQQTLLQDDSFLASVQPSSILLEVTAEEVERYLFLKSKGASYQMTLLPRKSSSAITESLSDIQEALAGIAGMQD